MKDNSSWLSGANEVLVDAMFAPNPLLKHLLGGPYVITREQITMIRVALLKAYKRPKGTKVWKMLKDLPSVETKKKATYR